MGTGQEIQSALTCLPQLSSVKTVTIQIQDDDDAAQVDFLELLPHVFPELSCLTLDHEQEEPDPNQSFFDMRFLDPLVACPKLESLSLYADVGLHSCMKS